MLGQKGPAKTPESSQPDGEAKAIAADYKASNATAPKLSQSTEQIGTKA